ncbi:MAG: glutamate-5-semialdehyde dehydrogenase [Alphaproteobacteria bacterium]
MSQAKQSKISPEETIRSLGVAAKKAAFILAQTPTAQINNVLNDLAQNIINHKTQIIDANYKDIAAAEQKNISPALIDRLRLSDERIKSLSDSVLNVMSLDDPTGKTLWETTRPNNLKIKRVSCQIGVLGMIYESRPNVTIDAAILCLKSHNAVILRGGSESFESSMALHKIIEDTLKSHGLSKSCVSMIPTSDRAHVGEMLRADQYIDVMIPRGGKTLIERVMNEARMPVFSHLQGLCHIYVDSESDLEMAKNITLNAKMRRTGICGAMETLLLDNKISDANATDIIENLLNAQCEIFGDERAQKLNKNIKKATEEDWYTEYLDAKLSVKFVKDIKEAVEHINHYGSHHTDSIITNNSDNAAYFQKNIDSGIVMHNASTQFADGGEFGMGAEIGIATGKMHARGPVGLEQLCTYKYLVNGNGQTRPQ